MSQFVVDQNVSVAFSRLCEPTRIVDAQGRMLGVFTPCLKPGETPFFDLVEAERIVKEQGHLGRPLEDIWNDIHAGRPMT